MEPNSILSKLKKPIFKILIGYIGIRELMNIFRYNKSIQNKMNIGLCSYIIFSNFVTQKIDVLNNKKLNNFYEKLNIKLKRNDLEEIQIGLCTCILFALKYNYSYNADMINYDLYPIYFQLKNQFDININLMFSEKFFTKKLFENIHYINFIKNNSHIFSGIIFNQIQSEILLNYCIDKNTGKKLLFDILQLKQFYFKNMKLTKDIVYLLNYFNLNYIEILSFIDCKLTLNCFEIISQKITSNNKFLTKLELYNCAINEKNIEKIFNNYHYLSYINLEKNKINDNSMNLFMEMEISKKLTGLNLSNNKFSSISFEKIANSINYFSNLKNLDLTNNNLKHSIKYIFKWNNPNLIFLNLSNCQIEDYEFNDNVINNLINLTNLILNKNNLGKVAIKFCFKIKSLISLKVSSSNLNNDSFSLVNDIKNNNLKFLFLSKNNITSDSIISLFKKSILQKLILIDLFNNQLNDDFVDYFIGNKNIIPVKMLNISLNNNISNEKKNQIYSLYEKYTQITNKSLI